jgi:hypothetical protein
MLPEKKKKRSFFQKLKSRYHLVIMNDETMEERFSFRLSRLNVFIVTGALIILLVILLSANIFPDTVADNRDVTSVNLC